MDRRAALKKLAAGGAIAAGGSFVLSSNQVAFAASGPVPPPPTEVIAYEDGGDTASFVIAGKPPETTSTSYQWQLNYVSLTPAGKKQVDLIDGNGNVLWSSNLGDSVCGRPCTPWTTSSTELGEVRLDRHTGLKPGDVYELDVIVSWTTTNGSVTSHYRIHGSYGTPPTIEVIA